MVGMADGGAGERTGLRGTNRGDEAIGFGNRLVYRPAAARNQG